MRDIKKSQKQEQRGSTFYVEKVSGKKTKSILIDNEMRNFIRTLCMIVLAMIAAFCIWWTIMRFIATQLEEIELIASSDLKLYRVFFCVFLYSIAVVYFNKFFKQVATKIVVAENHKYKKDHEESMIRKNYTLGAFNSYLGMSAASFYF